MGQTGEQSWRRRGTALLIALLPVAGLSLVACERAQPPSLSQDTAEDSASILIEEARAHTLPGAGAVYFLLENRGQRDRLMGASSPDAVSVFLHETRQDDDLVRMVDHTDGWDIAAGHTLTLAPGGSHLMLVDPAPDANPLRLVLHFEKAGDVRIEVPTVDSFELLADGEGHS